MREFDTEKPVPRAKAYGVLLAALVAVGSLVLVAITHEPPPAASSPTPANAGIVPQIADAKSEAEILLRGKSFADLKRQVLTHFGGEVVELKVSEGHAVDADATLGMIKLNRAEVLEIHKILYPEMIGSLESKICELELSGQKLVDVTLSLKQDELEKAREDLSDLKALHSEGMAAAEAVTNKKRELAALRKEISGIRDSIKQNRCALKQTKEDLTFYRQQHKRQVELLEWRAKRSFSQSGLPLNQALLKAPIAGNVVWVNPLLREGSELEKGFHAMTVAPMDALVVRCKVHELDLVKLRRGAPGTVIFDAIPQKKYDCRVARIPALSRNPALEVPADYEIECSLNEPDNLIREGLTCNVKVGVTQ
jgi:multidrug resistance efflux pump